MTNTTGTAQQRDQPTQLTADEARELHRLIQDWAGAKFTLGMHDGADPLDFESRAKLQDKADHALIALYNWEVAHGLSADAITEAGR